MYVNRLYTALYRVALKVALAFAFVLIPSLFLRAQERTLRVYYPYDDATLMRNYMNNAEIFAQFDEILAGGDVPSFEIVSYSSPEGDWNYNLRLSRRRANSLKAYLERTYPQLVGHIAINPNAESWDELHKLVSSDSRLSDSQRDEILKIVDSDKAPDVKEMELKHMEGYRMFYKNFFRSLRYAQISVVGEYTEPSKVADSGTDGVVRSDENVVTDSTSVISAVSENVEDSVITTETAEPASNNSSAVSGSAVTASVATPSEAREDTSVSEGEGTTVSAAGIPVVYFLYNEDFIRPEFKNNEANLQEIARMIRAGEVTDFTIAGFSSPEGSVKANESLSYRRAVAFKNYIVNLFPELESRITIVNGGENWSALREQVENGTALTESEKQEVLSIIDSNDDPQTKEFRLTRTTAYRKIGHKYFPNIRCASFVKSGNDHPANPNDLQPVVDTLATHIDTTDVQVDTTFTQIDTTDIQIDTIANRVDTTATTPIDTTARKPEVKQRYPVVAVSTNLALDAIVAPNFAIEVPLNKKLSAYAEYTFPWWLSKNNDWCYEMLKWDFGMRYRLGNNFDKNDPMDVLKGHFVGVDLSAGYYDFEPRHNGYQGEFQMATLEYGYAWDLGHNWRLDAVVGAGWMGTHYRYYEADPTDQHLIYKYSGKLNWMGPTKLGVSIKYIFTTSRRRNER